MSTKSYQPQSIYRVLLVVETNQESALDEYLADLQKSFNEHKSTKYKYIAARTMYVGDDYDKDIVQSWLTTEPATDVPSECDSDHPLMTILVEDFEPIRLN